MREAQSPARRKKRSTRLSDDKRFKIFSGSANRSLAEEVCKFVGVPLGETRLQRFSDGETHFQLLENVRGADVFLFQPTCFPVDQNLMELLIMMDALKRASAGRVTVVIPYYGYARARTAKTAPASPSPPSSSPTCSPPPGPTVPFSSTFTPLRSRASSTSPSITSSPVLSLSATSAT